MSKNLSYLKSNYSNHPPINIHQRQREREKSISLSPHRVHNQRKSGMQGSTKNEQLPSTEAKRNRQNDQDYSDHNARSMHYEKTSKKSLYPKQSPLQSSTNYNAYQGNNSTKIQLLREQSIYLSQQNGHLNQLLTEKNKIISSLQKKLQYQIQQEVMTLQQIEREKNKFLNDFHERDDQQRVEIQKLLIQLQHATEEIAAMRFQKEEILRANAAEFELIKATYTQQNRHLIDNVITKKEIDITTKDAQISQLNAIIDQLNTNLTTTKESAKQTQSHLNSHIAKLLEELQQVNHEKKIQLSQQKIAFDNIILTLSKEKQQEVSNTTFKYEVELKKYKNLLNQQILSNSNLQSLVQTARLQHSSQLQKRVSGQTQLKHQIYELENYYQQKNYEQISKQKELNSHQNKIIQKAIHLRDQQYEEDLGKLIAVNRQNKNEIQRLYTEIQKLRAEKKEEIQRVQRINNQLRQSINQLTQSNDQQNQTLKIKLGHLRHTDITTLKQYYQNQLVLKSQQIIDLEKILKDNRDKLHKELQAKVIERKHHERLVDDLRIKIGELELKIAMITEEHKEKVLSMGSQIEMTSMTMIRETAHKERHSQQTEIEKRNLQEIITTKDLEIEELNSKLTLIKKSHTQQVAEKEQSISILWQKNQQLNDEIKRERQFYQKEIHKKEQLKKETKQFYEIEIQKQKETYSKEFTEVTEKLMKEKNELSVRIQHLSLVQKQLRDELSLHAEHHEQRTLQKDVSYNEQRARIQYSKQSMQINLKNYYEKKITDIQEELKSTKQQLSEKSQDVRALNEKNYKLEKKIQKIMESQEKMRVLEEKVMALGQENNLVKNVAELTGTKSRRKPI